MISALLFGFLIGDVEGEDSGAIFNQVPKYRVDFSCVTVIPLQKIALAPITIFIDLTKPEFKTIRNHTIGAIYN